MWGPTLTALNPPPDPSSPAGVPPTPAYRDALQFPMPRGLQGCSTEQKPSFMACGHVPGGLIDGHPQDLLARPGGERSPAQSFSPAQPSSVMGASIVLMLQMGKSRLGTDHFSTAQQ